MRRYFAIVLAFSATLATALADVSELSPWFYENAESFERNLGGNWLYDPSVAWRVGTHVKITSANDESVAFDGEVRYHPDRPAPKKYVIGEIQASFDDVGNMQLDTKGSFAGVQVVGEDIDGEVTFAVLDPASGANAWRDTKVKAKLGCEYVLRYEIGVVSGAGGGRCVRYAYRQATEPEGDFHALATVTIPDELFGDFDVVCAGDGSLTTFDFNCKDGDDSALGLEVTDVSVDYGTDFTNATVTVRIENYWKGEKFNGDAYAQFFVYDERGRLVESSGAGGVVINGDGTFTIGDVHLPDGKGHDYRFEVEVFSEDYSTGDIGTIKESSIAGSGVRLDSGWIRETADTFAAMAPDERKTGEWSFPSGAAYVTNDAFIVVDTGETFGKVRFAPYEDVTNNVIRIAVNAVFNGASRLTGIAEPEAVSNRLAGVTVVSLDGDDRGEFAYAVWAPEGGENESGAFVPAFGAGEPTFGVPHLVIWEVNYETGHVSYSVDGNMLYDDNGVSSFPIPESTLRERKRVGFFGAGKFDRVIGDRYNSNLAAYVEDGVTNQYATVDEAVRATIGRNGQVQLLWDASWRPLAEDVGRTFAFDLNGHKLSIDPTTAANFAKNGYRVIDNGDGTFTIGVISYYITYGINGGDAGEMPDQAYSVTNMVFSLASNRFSKAGFSFAHWNEQEDGLGPTNWTDGAMIDMAPYGLTNMMLYAQWTVVIRTVLIEAADEFVYIDSVTTNGVENTGVRYFRGDAAKGTGHAVVPVENGTTEFVVRYATDIEKKLTFEFLKASEAILEDGIIEHDVQPTLFVDGVSEILTPIQYWALTHGISLARLSTARFATASYELDADTLLDDKCELVISGFRANEDGFAFTATLNEHPLADVSKLRGLIRVAKDPDGGEDGWISLPEWRFSLGADGAVKVNTEGIGDGSALFVKLVIQSDD